MPHRHNGHQCLSLMKTLWWQECQNSGQVVGELTEGSFFWSVVLIPGSSSSEDSQNNYLIQSYFNTREYSLFYIYSLDISHSSDNFRSWRTFFSRNVCSIVILGDIYHKWLVKFRINFTLLTLFRCGSGSPWQEEYHHVCDVTLPGTSAKCFYGSHPRGGDVTSGSHSQYHPCDNRGTLSDPDQAALLWAG